MTKNTPVTRVRALEVCFGIVALLNIAATFMQYQPLIWLTKPLLMCVLAYYFYSATLVEKWHFAAFINLGLVASIGGDTFLLWSDDLHFIAGLLCFLVAHLCYFIAFMRYKPTQNGLLATKWWWAIPFLVFWCTMNFVLWHKTGDLRVPVLVYSAVITAMAIGAVNLQGKTNAKLLLLGVLLFVSSDSVIAFSKFMPELNIAHAPFIIMLTYIIGQYFIAKGAIEINNHN